MEVAKVIAHTRAPEVLELMRFWAKEAKSTAAFVRFFDSDFDTDVNIDSNGSLEYVSSIWTDTTCLNRRLPDLAYRQERLNAIGFLSKPLG
jgi:hypothetical protein